MQIILCIFSEIKQYSLKNSNINLSYNNFRRSYEGINKSNFKRILLYEFQFKKLNEQLEQITLFNSQKQNKK